MSDDWWLITVDDYATVAWNTLQLPTGGFGNGRRVARAHMCVLESQLKEVEIKEGGD
jgi:hypothetical protein